MEISVIIGILGIVLAVGFLIYGSMKGIKLFPLVMIASAVVIATNRMVVWDALYTSYVTGMQSAITSFFWLLLAANLYSNVLEKTGSTQSIAWWCINRFGKKNIVLVLMIVAGLLGIAGMNAMMMCFALYAIICALLKEANLPRHMAICFIVFGGAQFAPAFMPASVAANNVIPTQFLGTTLLAGAVPGIIFSVIAIVVSYIYVKSVEKRARLRGEVWTDPVNHIAVPENQEEELPSAGKAFLPMILVVVCVIAGTLAGLNSTMIAVASMCFSALICGLLNMQTLKKADFNVLNYLEDGFRHAISSLAPLFAILGFGQIVADSVGFQGIVQWVINLDISVYFKTWISVAAISGVTGSSAGGLRLVFANLTDYFLNSGGNIEMIHRLASMTSNSLDTLPHCSAIFLFLNVFGLTHKEAYKHVFALSVVITTVLSIAMAVVATLLY